MFADTGFRVFALALSALVYSSLAVHAAPPVAAPATATTAIAIAAPTAAATPAAPERRLTLPPEFVRQEVDYATDEPVGTIVIDTAAYYLYLVLPEGRAMRYGIGVARDGFEWTGAESVSRKARWPTWIPPAEMLARQPELPPRMEGGPNNPLGARALYIGSTLYRIHGTAEPWTIGTKVSSGCFRLLNDDVIDLYERVKIGAKVIVL